ncbi:hypothetical protein CDN99_18045 [Roseateles aquatilis]|uniref:Long-chain-fatty-acyl-CoA reductase n=1 Tax=Roseateles aquatilis TaxID=431061 RepID=A0A246J4I0_9BURK|nr:acyl-CoA reductase [Roseateles aquatilis]OWQ87505.1 hypothetical protein CDN99_18045 [Roseateles aquatilis]
MSIRYILGAQDGAPIAQVLSSLRSQPAWRPFDERAVAFVRRFSQKLLTSAGIRQHPELAALGHWFRGANLQTLAGQYELETPQLLKLGRGLAFHLAPSNVDSVFMYSWLLSLLAGNVNLVRVSQKASAPLDFLVGALAQTLAEDVGAPVRERIVLLTYPHDEQLTRGISEACLIRVVWGGDATVRALRAIPLRPTAIEICFPDRFSACAIRASAVLEADDAALAQLATAFYNDAFWFAQQACSSPRLVAWVGDDATIDAAAVRFWAALDTELARRQPENSEAMNMARVAASFEYAAARLARPAEPGEFRGAHPMRLRMETPLDETAKTLHCGNGLFLETRLPRLAALAPQLSDKEQTLAVHGFPREELVELALALPPRAVDRFAKFGEALSFAPVWDGQDLITTFSRNVLLPTG